MDDLFRHSARKERVNQPLAERMRPATLEGFFGQRHVVGEGKLLARALKSGLIPSLILWGPPGTGKTTIARIIASSTGSRFDAVSAVGSGVKELRELVAAAADARDRYGRKSILFIDEIHRYNKAQQDALLPHVEAGTITLIGATTENPSFEVNAALLSRCRVVRLEPLEDDELLGIMRRALGADAELKQRNLAVDDACLETIARACHGDARLALTALEVAVQLTADDETALKPQTVEQALQRRTLLYDKAGEEHYNVVSAFIKSMRGSDPDAAVYWMARMLEAGEDPLFILRRMVIFASEDVGNADPQALQLAMAAMQAVHFVGLPEAVLPLTQAVTYLASAPKSNAALVAYGRARKDVRTRGPLPVPLKLRNAPTKLMGELGYGKGYRYPHDFDGHHIEETYLPDALARRIYYEPAAAGYEAEIRARLAELRPNSSASGPLPTGAAPESPNDASDGGSNEESR